MLKVIYLDEYGAYTNDEWPWAYTVDVEGGTLSVYSPSINAVIAYYAPGTWLNAKYYPE